MNMVQLSDRAVQRDAQRCPTCRLLPGRCRCWTPDERPNPFRRVITICRTCTEEQDSKVSLSDCKCWERLLPERSGVMTEEPCDCALLPWGDAPDEPCVHPLGHDGQHQTAQGIRWDDPDDGEVA